MSDPELGKITDKMGKLTMKDSYAKTRFWPKRVRAIFDLLRPFTLLAPYIVSASIIVASLIYNYKNGFIDGIPGNWWVTVGQASLTITIVNAASNSLNQATDWQGDKISKPYRPIPLGLIKPDEAQSIAYLLYLFALMRAVTINAWFGTFIFLIMIFTVTYSLPPRMKKYLFINQIWIAVPRGMFGILASWSVFGNPFTPLPLTVGAIATVYLIGGMSTKDITDAVADKTVGVKTMINTYGTKKTALMCFPFMVCPFAFIPILINQDLLPGYFYPLVGLVVLSIFIAYLMLRETESKTLENIHAWSIMYIEYMFFAIGFALLTIVGETIGFPKLF